MIFFSILILIVAIALPSINNNISSNIYIRISSIILLYSGLLALNAINIPALGSGIGLFSGLFHVTFISQLTDFFIFLIGSLILIAWPLINNIKYNKKLLSNRLINKINKINIYSTEYSLIILFSTLGGSLLVSSADIVSMYLSIELQSFGVYILSTIFRDSDTATSAGLKYFLLGGLSSCLILLGGGLIYSFTGLTSFEAIYSLISVSDNNYIIQGSNLGFIFMIVGLLFKVAAAPLHNWAPALCCRITLLWVKLSNSGDTLKLLIPNYIWKTISGWINYSCKVISQKIDEKKMGYRGSKSKLESNFVKEQRVDGSWFVAKIARSLRCTLMGREICYQVKIPSKQLNSQKYSFSTLTNNSVNNIINLWFLTGFIDAEGCFQISIRQDKKYKTNWRISFTFQIKLHVKDIALLNNIKNSLGVGTITLHNKDTANFNIYSINEIQVIIDHCVKYPLITAKYSDFLLFKQAFEIIKKGDHLTEKGLLEIVGLKSALNLGLSDKLKAAFPNFVPTTRPAFKFNGIPDPFWVAGFISGDGSFYLSIRSKISPTSAKGNIWRSVSLIFGVNLHIRDKDVIQALAYYFNSLNGNGSDSLTVKPYSISIRNHSVSLYIRRLSDIVNIIIPFFEKHPILGVKSLDFADFKKVVEIVQNKEHLTSSGFKSIKKINSTMNLRRPWGSDKK